MSNVRPQGRVDGGDVGGDPAATRFGVGEGELGAWSRSGSIDAAKEGCRECATDGRSSLTGDERLWCVPGSMMVLRRGTVGDSRSFGEVRSKEDEVGVKRGEGERASTRVGNEGIAPGPLEVGDMSGAQQVERSPAPGGCGVVVLPSSSSSSSSSRGVPSSSSNLNGVLNLAREGPSKEGREMGDRMGGDPSANEGTREGEDEDCVPTVGSGDVRVVDTTPATVDGPAPPDSNSGLTRVFVEA